jgi:hypothetical protein
VRPICKGGGGGGVPTLTVRVASSARSRGAPARTRTRTRTRSTGFRSSRRGAGCEPPSASLVRNCPRPASAREAAREASLRAPARLQIRRAAQPGRRARRLRRLGQGPRACAAAPRAETLRSRSFTSARVAPARPAASVHASVMQTSPVPPPAALPRGARARVSLTRALRGAQGSAGRDGTSLRPAGGPSGRLPRPPRAPCGRRAPTGSPCAPRDLAPAPPAAPASAGRAAARGEAGRGLLWRNLW